MTERRYCGKTLEPPIHKLVLPLETALEKSPESAIKMLKNIRGKISKGIDIEILAYLIWCHNHYVIYHDDHRYEDMIKPYSHDQVKKALRRIHELEAQYLLLYRATEIHIIPRDIRE